MRHFLALKGHNLYTLQCPIRALAKISASLRVWWQKNEYNVLRTVWTDLMGRSAEEKPHLIITDEQLGVDVDHEAAGFLGQVQITAFLHLLLPWPLLLPFHLWLPIACMHRSLKSKATHRASYRAQLDSILLYPP